MARQNLFLKAILKLKMNSEKTFIPLETKKFQPANLEKGTWLAILHAERIPPHVGLIFSGNYNSLTIKETELNISTEILLKTITQKKIKSIFLKIADHPVFSIDHQQSIFEEQLKKFGSVKPGEGTCLSPIKIFFLEFYVIQSNENELLFDFIRQLNSNKYINYAFSLNMEINAGFNLPCYTVSELQDKIKKEQQTNNKNVFTIG